MNSTLTSLFHLPSINPDEMRSMHANVQTPPSVQPRSTSSTKKYRSMGLAQSNANEAISFSFIYLNSEKKNQRKHDSKCFCAQPVIQLMW